jgi:serine/threonine protein kinase
VKLTDIFLGWIFDSAELPRRDVMVTALYISPEQALGRDQATASSDVYSLGVVGYESISGQQPFTGDGALTVAMKHIEETPPTLHAQCPRAGRDQPGEGSFNAL